MKKLYIGALILFALAGCAGTASKTNQVSLGMTKQEVITALGDPSSSRATGGVEYLTYKLTPGTTAGQGAGCAALGLLTFGGIYISDKCTGGKPEDYFFQFRNNQLIEYGKVGDFNSTKNPTLDLNIKNK